MIKIGKYKENSIYLDAQQNPNGHILVVGKSGMGKTIFSEKLLLEIIKNNGTCIVFDLHHVFANNQLLETLRDEFIKKIHEVDVYSSGIPCPLFTPAQFSDGTQEKQYDIIYGITDIMAGALGLQNQQKSCLKDAIQYIYDNNLYPEQGIAALEQAFLSITNHSALNVKDKLAQVINHNIFVNGTSFIEEGKINILRLSKFDSSTQSLITEMVLFYIWRMASSNGLSFNNLYIALDEFQNLSLGKNSALSQLLSEGRKFHINLLLVTQALSMCFNSAEQKRLMQSGLQIYFRPPANEARLIAKMLDCNKPNEWITILNSLRIGEFIGNGAMLVEKHAIEQPIRISSR